MQEMNEWNATFGNGQRESKKERKRRIDRIKARRLRYGISQKEYEELFEQQQGKCLCCGQEEQTPHARQKRDQKMLLIVDHCHITGAIRGLLCWNCNLALGMLKEDPERIKLLLTYVEERCLW